MTARAFVVSRTLVPPRGRALAVLLTLAASLPAAGAEPAARRGPDHLTYHGTAQRTGWVDDERQLTPRAVASPRFGLLWESPPLDAAEGSPPRLFASPLYVERVPVRGAAAIGRLRSCTWPVRPAMSTRSTH